jgi:L-seryl-tRNA(Ser) seleniumtransferase
MSSDYQRLPSVDRVLADERMQRTAGELGRTTALAAARGEIAARREALANGGALLDYDAIVAATVARAYESLRPTLRPVINATGVIIHTNLGRAPLSDDAIAAMDAVNRGYSNLEYDLDAGERGSRHQHLEDHIRRVTGAEAAMAVNNNASALLLTLSALCQGREVVISRGQLVEIGGGFRIPDVMAQSGAHLVEVGTTNRTYLRDYEAAATEETAALMRVHASNFRVIGFVTSPEIADLARLAHERGLLLLDDLGSGCLLDTRQFGLLEEPTPVDSLQAGTDLVLFSADKLLGGPQAGVIAGRRELIETLRRHPLARAVRMDKGSIAGLNATLLHYARGEALQKVPVWRMIAAPLGEVDARATQLASAIGHDATVVDGRSMIGGGSLPEESLPSRLVCLHARDVESLARRLRLGDPAVVGRIEHDTLLLDPRTVASRDLEALAGAVSRAIDDGA